MRHDVLYAMLSRVGFGKITLQCVAMAYSNCTIKVIRDRHLSDRVHVPCRRCFFDLPRSISFECAEVWNWSWFSLPRGSSKVAGVRRRAGVLAAGCLESVPKNVQLTNIFCEASGAAVRWEKSCGFFTVGGARRPML